MNLTRIIYWLPAQIAKVDESGAARPIVAGLGNIYVCEALFRAGISPRRRRLISGTSGSAG